MRFSLFPTSTDENMIIVSIYITWLYKFCLTIRGVYSSFFNLRHENISKNVLYFMYKHIFTKYGEKHWADTFYVKHFYHTRIICNIGLNRYIMVSLSPLINSIIIIIILMKYYNIKFFLLGLVS